MTDAPMDTPETEAEGLDLRISTAATASQGFAALVWRRFRKSTPGMIGLMLVALLLLIALFAQFFAPVDPRCAYVGFAPPDKVSWYVPGDGDNAGWRLFPVVFPTVEGAESDPVTYGSKTMALRQVDDVKGALAVGASDARIITRHILPNVMSHVIVSVTMGIPSIVLLESFLGFPGFAVKPPLISWGLMLQDAGTFATLGTYPWILAPVGFVLLTVFAFNALGDGLRDAIDPY